MGGVRRASLRLFLHLCRYPVQSSYSIYSRACAGERAAVAIAGMSQCVELLHLALLERRV